MTDTAAVLFANEAFYAAFTNRDLDAMTDVWSSDERITCLHPGWPPLFGYDEVMESWDRILTNEASPEVTCRDAQAFIRGDVAYVICYEALTAGALLATNIFIRDGGRWWMIHHQAGAASPLPPDEEDDESNEMLQ